jgi:hypothetical protein
MISQTINLCHKFIFHTRSKYSSTRNPRGLDAVADAIETYQPPGTQSPASRVIMGETCKVKPTRPQDQILDKRAKSALKLVVLWKTASPYRTPVSSRNK